MHIIYECVDRCEIGIQEILKEKLGKCYQGGDEGSG